MVCLVLEATFNTFNHIVTASYPITRLLGSSVSIYLCKRVIIGPPSKRNGVSVVGRLWPLIIYWLRSDLPGLF